MLLTCHPIVAKDHKGNKDFPFIVLSLATMYRHMAHWYSNVSLRSLLFLLLLMRFFYVSYSTFYNHVVYVHHCLNRSVYLGFYFKDSVNLLFYPIVPPNQIENHVYFFTGKLTILSIFFLVLRREVSLHEACKNNNIEMVKKILQDKIDINCKNNVRPLKLGASSNMLYLFFINSDCLVIDLHFTISTILWNAKTVIS